jgi:hypothetical protein
MLLLYRVSIFKKRVPHTMMSGFKVNSRFKGTCYYRTTHITSYGVPIKSLIEVMREGVIRAGLRNIIERVLGTLIFTIDV